MVPDILLRIPYLPVSIPFEQLEPLLLTPQEEQILYKAAQFVDALTLRALVVALRAGVLHVIVEVDLGHHFRSILRTQHAARLFVS